MASSCEGAKPDQIYNWYWRHIGTGLFSEWGIMDYYTGANFNQNVFFWTQDRVRTRDRGGREYLVPFMVESKMGSVKLPGNFRDTTNGYGLCVYP